MDAIEVQSVVQDLAAAKQRVAELELQLDREQGWIRGGTKEEVGCRLSSICQKTQFTSLNRQSISYALPLLEAASHNAALRAILGTLRSGKRSELRPRYGAQWNYHHHLEVDGLQAAQVKARRDRIKEQESEIAQLKKQLGSDKVTFGGRTGGRDLYSAVPAEYLCPITQVQHYSLLRSSASHSFSFVLRPPLITAEPDARKISQGLTCRPERLQSLLSNIKVLLSTAKTTVPGKQ